MLEGNTRIEQFGKSADVDLADHQSLVFRCFTCCMDHHVGLLGRSIIDIFLSHCWLCGLHTPLRLDVLGRVCKGEIPQLVVMELFAVRLVHCSLHVFTGIIRDS